MQLGRSSGREFTNGRSTAKSRAPSVDVTDLRHPRGAPNGVPPSSSISKAVALTY